MFNPGLEIYPQLHPLGFSYGQDCFGPMPEARQLDDIRQSLRAPDCIGPELVYAISMDVGKKKDKKLLEQLNLLFGAVAFASGRLGDEPIRSQGHIHAVSSLSGMSTPELYEVWNGKAIIFAQESTEGYPGRCYAVEADPGDVVLVPPGWAHCTISADSESPLAFGAWCVREYGFEYDGVRSHGGLAYYPVWKGNNLSFEKNSSYADSNLVRKKPRQYKEFGIERGKPIYLQFEDDPEKFMFITHPEIFSENWDGFVP